MNKSLNYLLGLSLACSVSQAQNIAVTSDWKLVGATEDITITNFDNTCTNTVWWYDAADNFDWKLYMNTSSYLSIPANTELKTDGTITKGSGFWIKGDEPCTVDTNVATSAPVSTTYTLSSSDVSGKTFTIDGNDNQGWVTFSLKTDGTGTEIGYYQNGLQEYSENITWSIDSGKLKIKLNSDNSIAHLSFNSKPANTVTGKYIGDETIDIDVSNFSDVSNEPDYTGIWRGTMFVNIPAAASSCNWNISITINSDNTAYANASLTNTTGYGAYECDNFSSNSGLITSKTDSGFSVNIDSTSSDYIFAGNTFNMSVNNNTATETKSFTYEGYAGTRTTSILK